MSGEGVTLVGRIQGVSGSRVTIAEDLKENLANGDLRFTEHKTVVDDYIRKTGLNIPEEISADSKWPSPMKFCARYWNSV